MKKLTIGMMLVLLLSGMFIGACGGGDDDEEDFSDQLGGETGDLSDDEKEMFEDILEQMEKAREAMEDIDARAAYEMALPEALAWDSDARLYQIDTDGQILPDGTSAMWRVYFAVQEDAANLPDDRHGKKFFVMIGDGEINYTEAWETPEEISSRAECHLFVPEGWMNSDEAYSRCIDALETIYGDETATGEVSYFECAGREYYVEGPQGRHWEFSPVWVLSHHIGDEYARADIHAVTGEIVELK